MNAYHSVSVVIPCFNDASTLPTIISVLNQSVIGQVVIVDDGSNPPLPHSLTSLHPHLTLIRHPQNLGKSLALKTGLAAAKCPIILFLDSDLLGLTSSHIKLLTQPVIRKQCNMLIGEVTGLLPIFQLTGYSIAYSGLRCFNKTLSPIVRKSLNHVGYINGFLVEAQMNSLLFGHYKICGTRLAGLSQSYKISKFGIKGLINDLKIMYKIGTYLGWFRHLSQLRFSRQLITRH
ncbi:MAG: glycosyltransferase family 2 protein [Candidatus Shapirobacteria bacterium]